MKKTLFNSDWYFSEFPLGTVLKDVTASDSFVPVTLPHDYMIYHVSDLYKDSVGIYKKSFFLQKERNHTYLLRFEGVYMDCQIYLNGILIFEWKYGYSTFDADLTKYLNDGENEIYVACNYQSPNTRWYSGAGIYRNVWLIDEAFAYIPMDGIYVSMEERNGDFLLSIDTEALSKIESCATIKHSLFDNNGITINEFSKECSLTPNVSVITQNCTVPSPKLWDIEVPVLYTLRTELLVDNQVLDCEEFKIGFKTLRFDKDKGFFLNGRNVKINGACMHHDLGALGAAMNKTALRRQFEKLIEMGVNSIRTSHNMPSVEVMDLADEMGLLIMSEGFDMWENKKTDYDYSNYFNDWYKKDVRSWIRRDRNHPSLFVWSIGNEISDTNEEKGREIASKLSKEVRVYDYKHNAYTGIASNYIEWDNAQKASCEVELSGFNYYERLYDAHHKKYPGWCIYGSETSSTVQSRGVYHFPYEVNLLTFDDGQCSCLGNCTTNWGAKNTEAVIIDHRDRDFVFGQYIWTGWDYIGEPTPYHSKSSFFGQIDTAGFEKDTFYQYKAEWTGNETAPFVHLLPYWDFNEGQIIDVMAYTNATSLELFLNDESYGKQLIDHKKGKELKGHWKVPYKKGSLKVNAYDKSGKLVASETKNSFDDPASINLSTSTTSLECGKDELAFITITMNDAKGNPVENARNRVYVEVTGAGKLVGLDNGDSTDYEEYKCNSRKLFSGKLLAIVAPTDNGEINVKVSSFGLPDASVTISTRGFTYSQYSHDTIKLCEVSNECPARKIEIAGSGLNVLTKDDPSMKLTYKVYPRNSTYKDVTFKCLTKDGIEANFAKAVACDGTVTVTATGDGFFTLTAFCNIGKNLPEVVSTIDFECKDLGIARFDPTTLVPGICYTASHSNKCKVSFLGGVFLPASSESISYITFDNLDFKDKELSEIHIPIFTFLDELPIRIHKGDINSPIIFEGLYKAKSIYNVYQENTFKLPVTFSGKDSITLEFPVNQTFSVQGFYFK